MDTKAAIQLINYATEKAHSRHLTFGFGHIMLYNEKAEQAADYIAAKYPKDLSGYPLIEAESKGSKKCAHSVADGIIQKRSDWVAVCAKIERIRFDTIKKMSTSGSDVTKIVTSALKKIDAI